MMLLARVLAQVVDLIVSVFVFIVTFRYILPFLAVYIENNTVQAVLGIIIVIALLLVIQGSFLMNQQTIGKAFFGLKIISTEPTREKLTISIMLQRELLCKLMSCYLICIPALFGKAGGHEEATRTVVVGAKRKR